MHLIVAFCLLFATPLLSTHLFFFEEPLSEVEQSHLFDLILEGEPPRAFFTRNPIDLESNCKTQIPSISLVWVPPMLWQLGMLHSFFKHPEIRDGILACGGTDWDPLTFDGVVHLHLQNGEHLDHVITCFDQATKSLPEISQLFFKINEALCEIYTRSHGDHVEFLRIVLSEIPPFEEWKERGFPFWSSPWIYDVDSAWFFYQALQDKARLAEFLQIEETAHENGEWVLYRGYQGLGYPSSLEIDQTHSHALSFGSTLLGGTFFSIEACALKYSKSNLSSETSFLALKVSPDEMNELFRVGPLHPFIQMLVDGEMFHAHTKVSSYGHDQSTPVHLPGYFMKCNRTCIDPFGYIIDPLITAEDLEIAFLSLCKRAGTLFSNSLIEE